MVNTRDFIEDLIQEMCFLNISYFEIKGLETNQWAPCHDENKSEVYSLGICLIELARKKKLCKKIEDE